MRPSVLWAGFALAVLILVLAFGVFVWPGRYRYEHIQGGALTRIDRMTGEVDLLTTDDWTCLAGCPRPPVPSNPPTASTPSADTLDQEAIGLLDLRNAQIDSIGYLTGDLYNGSNWTVTQLTLSIAVCGKEETTRKGFTPLFEANCGKQTVLLSRKYQIQTYVQPLNSTSISEHIGVKWDRDTLDTWKFRIVEAKGTKTGGVVDPFK